MRHIINSLLASMLLLASCTTDTDLGVALTPTLEPFYASIEGSTTRTYIGEGDKLLWSAGDRVTVFNGNTTPLEYQFAGDNGAASGALNPVSPASVDSGSALSANYAIYPHSASTTITDEGVIKINYTIPATQTYAENSFGLGANVMVAVSEDVNDRNFAFKNVGGYFEFSLYGDNVTVQSIAFSGNNNEKLAGNVTITATHDGIPSLSFADDATTTLTLDCGEGVELGADAEHATKFWFVVPAIAYENGITITITDTEGKIMEKSTENEIVIGRSTVQPLATFEVETYMPTNQIWYTSSDGEVVTPRQTDVFGANIESNVYENGKGVITFDGPVTTIGTSAFILCSSLESITIPEGVTRVEDKAFQRCTSLKSITIPEGVTSIGNYAFDHCSSLKSITIPDGVTSIGNYAFSYCSSLESITIPEGVQSIGFGTFKSCSSLASVTLSDGVNSIGEEAFMGCSSLESITIPEGVTSIGNSAFQECESLESIAIPDSVTSIGEFAFYGCSLLESITIPDGVTSIGNSAFQECESLESIIIPEGVLSIGNFAFSGCSKVESITIPEGVTSIGNSAFQECESLESITIPDSVTSIGEFAFSGCSELATVYCKPITPPSAYEAFADCPNLSKIYVPEASVETYKDTDGWSGYASIIEGYTF